MPLMFVGIAMYAISQFVIKPKLQTLLGDAQLSPDSEIPWYFVQRDFISGLSLLIGFIILLLLVYVIAKRMQLKWKDVIGSVLPLSAFFALPVFQSAVIFFKVGNVLNVQTAKIAWPTSSAYFDDKWLNLWGFFL